MNKIVTFVMAAAVMMVGAISTASAEKIIIGQFGNPTPMQVAKAEKKFSKATGWDIEWRKFSSGTDVIAAMASGDIKIAELGSSPLAIGASQGIDLQLFMMAQVIGEAESLIVRNGSGIKTLADMKGKKIAVPIGSTAHFSLMGAINKAGLKESDVNIINMKPDQIAAAWEQKAIDGAFIWQPVQSKLLKSGKLLVGADKTAAWGYPTFDGWVVNKDFAAKNQAKMVAFIKTMDAANAAYLNNKSAWTSSSAEVKTIAAQTGAGADQIPNILKGFQFLPIKEQIGTTWLDGSAAKAMKSTADFLKAAGKINSAADNYDAFVNLDLPKMAAK